MTVTPSVPMVTAPMALRSFLTRDTLVGFR